MLLDENPYGDQMLRSKRDGSSVNVKSKGMLGMVYSDGQNQQADDE